MVNDACGFLFGKIFGKWPLIALSPKKTLEGYLGGALGTIFLGIIFSFSFNVK